MCLCVECVHECGYPWNSHGGMISPGAGITFISELCDKGSGNQTQVLPLQKQHLLMTTESCFIPKELNWKEFPLIN